MDDRFERATLFSGVATSSECTGGWGGGGGKLCLFGGGCTKSAVDKQGAGVRKKGDINRGGVKRCLE